jgi:hypothetical protein
MDKLTSINWIVDAIDNTILWMFLVYLIDVYFESSPTLPSVVHHCVLKWKLTFTHLHSVCLVGILPSNIHHASLRDRLSSGRFALHDRSHFFKRTTLFDTECQVKAQTLNLTPPLFVWDCNRPLPWACGAFTDECTQPGFYIFFFTTLKHPSHIPVRQAFIG